MIFSELQSEVKRGAIRDQSGTVFDDGIKNVINRGLYRLSRESAWRSLRRKSFFQTVEKYTTGSGAVTATNNSTGITITGATLITDNISIGRRLKLSGSGVYFTIRTITGETTLTLDKVYDGVTTTTGTYSILGQGEYNLPIQAGHRMFMWHEEYGYPYQMVYLTEQELKFSGAFNTNEAIPTHYTMWGDNMVIKQVLEPTVITAVSSNASDTTQQVTIFGTVSGYPDFEVISLNGTVAVVGTKSFSKVERIVKNASTEGRITATGNTGNTTVAVMPTGNTTSGIQYKKINILSLPDSIFDMNVQYYKDPYKLVNDGDVHELGEEFDQALIFLSVAILKYENNQDEGDKFLGLYKDELKLLRKTNMDKIDWFPILKRAKNSRGRSGRYFGRGFSPVQAGPYYSGNSYF